MSFLLYPLYISGFASIHKFLLLLPTERKVQRKGKARRVGGEEVECSDGAAARRGHREGRWHVHRQLWGKASSQLHKKAVGTAASLSSHSVCGANNK